MAFGWSAGDILAAMNFVITVAKALDDASGAAQEFREASAFLRDLHAELTPLQKFTALDAEPAYKKEIECQVQAIKVPIERFINDAGVVNMQKSLGVIKEGHLKHFTNVKSKLTWHYSTAEKANALQKVVGQHLRIINMLMQRLTVDMLQKLRTEQKGELKQLLVKLSSRDEQNLAKLIQQLEKALESYLGKEQCPSPALPIHPLHPDLKEEQCSSAILKKSIGHLRGYCANQITAIGQCQYRGTGITGDPEVVRAIEVWWRSPMSELLCIQLDDGESSIAQEIVAVARESQVHVAAYFCERVDANCELRDPRRQFIELLYCLIYQLCLSMSQDLTTATLDRCVARLSALDMPIKSADIALELISDLIQLQKSPVLIVIDGIEDLDDSDDFLLQDHFQQIFSIIRNEGGKTIVKAFFRVGEICPLVLNVLGCNTMIDARSSNDLGGSYALEDFEHDILEQTCARVEEQK